jgi:hypothetical protein
MMRQDPMRGILEKNRKRRMDKLENRQNGKPEKEDCTHICASSDVPNSLISSLSTF